MNDYISNKVLSFTATEEVMIRNEAIWKVSENAARQFSAIQAKLPLISVYSQAQKNGKSVSIKVKKEVKTNLIEISLKISDSAVDYAAGIKDRTLELQVTFTKSSLQKLRQIPLYNTISKFYDLVSPLKSNFKHLDATDMDTFHSLLEEYKKAIPEAEADSDTSKTATQNVSDLKKEINDMYIELDKYIRPFSYTHADFYRDYSYSRSAKNFRGRGKVTKKSKNSKGSEETKAA